MLMLLMNRWQELIGFYLVIMVEMEMQTQTRQRMYEDLYAYYFKSKDYKMALFVQKYFLEGIKDSSTLKQQLGVAGDRTIRYRKARVSKDLVKLKIITNDKVKSFR